VAVLVQVLAVVQAVARVPAQVLAAALQVVVLQPAAEPLQVVAQRPVLEVRQPVLVEQLLRAGLPQQVVQLLPELVLLRRRVQPQQQPLQRLVWWRLVLRLLLSWLLQRLRKTMRL
jgi:hypothetical protein